MYPTLCVEDVRATVDFYEQRLGFDVQFLWEDPPTHAAVARGKVCVHFTSGVPYVERNWLYFHVEDLSELHESYVENGLDVSAPEAKPWGMIEFELTDLNGYKLVFGASNWKHGPSVPIARKEIHVSIEERLAGLLEDLAMHKEMSLGEMLEETILHTFERAGDPEQEAVASPHSKRTLDYIQELKKRHKIDYETHDCYRFKDSAESS